MNVKKRLILYLPYLVIGLYAGKLPQAWRMAAGVNAAEKLLSIMGGMELAFASPLPSFYLPDLSSFSDALAPAAIRHACGSLPAYRPITRYGRYSISRFFTFIGFSPASCF